MSGAALIWRRISATHPEMVGHLFVVECCGRRPRGCDVICAETDAAARKRGQPPFRYRCDACGPTQDLCPLPGYLAAEEAFARKQRRRSR